MNTVITVTVVVLLVVGGFVWNRMRNTSSSGGSGRSGRSGGSSGSGGSRDDQRDDVVMK